MASITKKGRIVLQHYKHSSSANLINRRSESLVNRAKVDPKRV